MKKKEFEAIGKRLLLDLPSTFTAHGELLFMSPIDHTLRGICFDASGDPRRFYIEVLAMPLFYPIDHVWFDIGFRLANRHGHHLWDADDPDLIEDLTVSMQRDALPFLFSVRSPIDVANAANEKARGELALQVLAFALVLSGETVKAVAALDQFVEYVWPNHVKSGFEYWKEEIERAQTLKALIEADPAASRSQVEAWEDETARRLKVARFRKSERIRPER